MQAQAGSYYSLFAIRYSPLLHALSRNSRLITLPVVVIGIASMKAISRGYSWAERRVRTKSRIWAASASDGACSGLSTMNALTISVRTGSGLPIAAC